MDNEKITRQQHLVPEAIRAIRAELMQKEDRRHQVQPSADYTAPERKKAAPSRS